MVSRVNRQHIAAASHAWRVMLAFAAGSATGTPGAISGTDPHRAAPRADGQAPRRAPVSGRHHTGRRYPVINH